MRTIEEMDELIRDAEGDVMLDAFHGLTGETASVARLRSLLAERDSMTIPERGGNVPGKLGGAL